ncbi:MAG: WGxxGxxG-CTERM domain-containing protein [Planctomycetaceae bacterium]|nr:WGxxGxxG-CTERM domain-containing protein [Planctomycetaceae bacterium]
MPGDATNAPSASTASREDQRRDHTDWGWLGLLGLLGLVGRVRRDDRPRPAGPTRWPAGRRDGAVEPQPRRSWLPSVGDTAPAFAAGFRRLRMHEPRAPGVGHPVHRPGIRRWR